MKSGRNSTTEKSVTSKGRTDKMTLRSIYIAISFFLVLSNITYGGVMITPPLRTSSNDQHVFECSIAFAQPLANRREDRPPEADVTLTLINANGDTLKEQTFHISLGEAVDIELNSNNIPIPVYCKFSAVDSNDAFREQFRAAGAIFDLNVGAQIVAVPAQ